MMLATRYCDECVLGHFKMRSMSGNQRATASSHYLVQFKSIGTIFVEIHRYFAKRMGSKVFVFFYPILANFNHKATYRRQTISILLRHVGLLRLLVPSWKHIMFEKSKIFFEIFIFQRWYVFSMKPKAKYPTCLLKMLIVCRLLYAVHFMVEIGRKRVLFRSALPGR